MPFTSRVRLVALASFLALTACGGGSTGTSAPPVPNAPVTAAPTSAPVPTAAPSTPPTAPPTTAPTTAPTSAPTAAPTSAPTSTPPTAAPAPVGNGSGAALYLNDDDKIVDGDPSTASIAGAPGRNPIDGIACKPDGPLQTHYHVHVTVSVNGKQIAVPSGIGVYDPVVADGPGTYFVNASSTGCYYDIHVHSAMGIIHVESATAGASFTLGQFLDIWGQSLSTSGFGSNAGQTRWFETDETTGAAGSHPVKELTGTDPRLTPLVDHHEYTIEVGTPVPTRNFTWASYIP